MSFKVDPRAAAIQAKITKEFGAGAIMTASEMHIPRRYTSGSLLLDLTLGGGWPGNQFVEIYGPENHGKTAITLKTIAANQAEDSNFFVFWAATEAYDLDQARALGVDTDRVHVLPSNDMPFVYERVLEYVEERAADMVVIDSYPAMLAPEEDSKDMDDHSMTEGARMTNKFFRKMGKAGLRDPRDPGDRPWVGVFVNQPRDKIGGWAPGGKTPETTSGGRGKNFACYVRLEVKRTEWIYEGPKKTPTRVGQVIKTTTIKNKAAPPMQTAFLDFYFTEAPEHGFHRGDYDVTKDTLTAAILLDVVKKSGGWYTFGEQRWQGLDNVKESVQADAQLLANIDKMAREQIAATPESKRVLREEDVVSAATAKTTVKRRRQRGGEESDGEN